MVTTQISISTEIESDLWAKSYPASFFVNMLAICGMLHVL